jgi:serine-type D-Ala-D-Ala carboxypeptidase (penicillin-binding protein 5/6)
MENLQEKYHKKPPIHLSTKCLKIVLANRRLEPQKPSVRCPSIGSLSTSSKSEESRPSRCERRKRYHSQSTIPKITAGSWCIMEKTSSSLLYTKNDSEVREIASLTKIMTCIVSLNLLKTFDKDNINTLIKVSYRASQVTGTSAELKNGDEISIKSLLYGLMLPSGNDAAWALAEFFGSKISPSSSKPAKRFVSEMNKTARELDLHSTHFGNPHGLIHNRNLSTARDVGKLACYCLKDQIFREIVNTKSYTAEIKGQDGFLRFQSWENTNKLLGKGFDGVKTGITPNAGPCLCVSLNTDIQIVIVLLNSKTMEDRWIEAKKLADWAAVKFF